MKAKRAVIFVKHTMKANVVEEGDAASKPLWRCIVVDRFLISVASAHDVVRSVAIASSVPALISAFLET